jgi:mono/diheme cytochrome c family protein
MAVQRIIASKMVLKNTFVATIALMMTACSSPQTPKAESVSEDANEPMGTEDARTVYTLNCASCHGQDGKLGASGAADLSKSTKTEPEIKRIILKGNDKGMMPYEQVLSAREIEGLVQFVQTLRTE